jgi:uncharacterized protein YceH (UPF0502 family)
VTIIADRGLFVRLLVQSGRFEQPAAEAFADALDAAAKEPATRADLTEAAAELRAEVAAVRSEVAAVRSEVAAARSDLRSEIAAVRSEVALQAQRMDAMEKRLDGRIDSVADKLLVRLGALIIAASGALFAALRLTQS